MMELLYSKSEMTEQLQLDGEKKHTEDAIDSTYNSEQIAGIEKMQYNSPLNYMVGSLDNNN